MRFLVFLGLLGLFGLSGCSNQDGEKVVVDAAAFDPSHCLRGDGGGNDPTCQCPTGEHGATACNDYVCQELIRPDYFLQEQCSVTISDCILNGDNSSNHLCCDTALNDAGTGLLNNALQLNCTLPEPSKRTTFTKNGVTYYNSTGIDTSKYVTLSALTYIRNNFITPYYKVIDPTETYENVGNFMTNMFNITKCSDVVSKEQESKRKVSYEVLAKCMTSIIEDTEEQYNSVNLAQKITSPFVASPTATTFGAMIKDFCTQRWENVQKSNEWPKIPGSNFGDGDSWYICPSSEFTNSKLGGKEIAEIKITDILRTHILPLTLFTGYDIPEFSQSVCQPYDVWDKLNRRWPQSGVCKQRPGLEGLCIDPDLTKKPEAMHEQLFTWFRANCGATVKKLGLTFIGF